MKNFTKEQAIEDLKGKFANKVKDIDLEKTITNAVETCMEMVGEESEMELNVFSERVEKLVASAVGMTRHENAIVATKLQERIVELEGKTKPTSPTPDLQTLGKMQEEITRLKEINEQRVKSERISEKKRLISEKMYEKGIADKEWIKSYLAEITITDDTDVEKKTDDFVAFYNKSISRGGKTTPKGSGGVSSDNYVNDTVKKITESMVLKNTNK